MPRIASSKIEVHLFRRRRGRVEFLALRRAPDRAFLPGVWQPVTGNVRRFERAADAARREVREETGLEPKHWWALESPTVFYDVRHDTMELLPVFAAEIDARASVTLSKEHDKYRFLSAAEAGRRYRWDSQRAALEALRREVLSRREDGARAIATPARRRRP